MNKTKAKSRTVYPGTYSRMGKHVLCYKLNIDMELLEDSIAIYRLNNMYEMVGKGCHGIDIVDEIIEMIAERSNN